MTSKSEYLKVEFRKEFDKRMLDHLGHFYRHRFEKKETDKKKTEYAKIFDKIVKETLGIVLKDEKEVDLIQEIRSLAPVNPFDKKNDQKKVLLRQMFCHPRKGVEFVKTKGNRFTPAYYGHFSDHEGKNVREGRGILFNTEAKKNGEIIFVGDFRKGLKEGRGKEFGIVLSKNLDKKHRMVQRVLYEGGYRRGQRHGGGECFDISKGETFRGWWENGVLNRSLGVGSCPVLPYDEMKEILQDQMTEENNVGTGSFGSVFKIETSKFQTLSEIGHTKAQHVAVKFVKYFSYGQEEEMEYETLRKGIKLSRAVNEKCKEKPLVDTIAVYKGPECIGTVMELMDKNVSQLIVEKDSGLTISVKIRILYGTAKVMQTLHSYGIMHRDLKWSQVFLDFEGVVKIGGFDTLRFDEKDFHKKIELSPNVGSVDYAAPETFKGRFYDKKIDVFSFGLMMYELLFEKKKAFASIEECTCGDTIRESRTDLLQIHINECHLRPPVTLEETKKYQVPKELVDVMQKCWEHEPSKRINFDGVVQSIDLWKESKEVDRDKEVDEMKIQVEKYSSFVKSMRTKFGRLREVLKDVDPNKECYKVLETIVQEGEKEIEENEKGMEEEEVEGENV